MRATVYEVSRERALKFVPQAFDDSFTLLFLACKNRSNMSRSKSKEEEDVDRCSTWTVCPWAMTSHEPLSMTGEGSEPLLLGPATYIHPGCFFFGGLKTPCRNGTLLTLPRSQGSLVERDCIHGASEV
jgi:hypothetical protein